jgi:hypothetical protein
MGGKSLALAVGAEFESVEGVTGPVCVSIAGSGTVTADRADGIPSVTTGCWAKPIGADDTTSTLVIRAQHPSVRSIGLFFAVIGRDYPDIALLRTGAADGSFGTYRVCDIGRAFELTVPIPTGQTCIAIVTPE